MPDLNDPRISAYRAQRRLAPLDAPGSRKLSEARKKQLRENQARAAARNERFHLAGLSSAGVIVMGVILGLAVLVLLVIAVIHP